MNRSTSAIKSRLIRSRTNRCTGIRKQMSQVKTRPKLKEKQTSKILYETQKARSDLIELKRDLATYEINMLVSTSVHSKLAELAKLAESIQGYPESLFNFDVELVANLHKTETKRIQYEDIDTVREEYIVSRVPTPPEMTVLLQGAYNISGQVFIVSIKQENFANCIQINAFSNLGLSLWTKYYKRNQEHYKDALLRAYVWETSEGFELKIGSAMTVLCTVQNLGLCCVSLHRADLFVNLAIGKVAQNVFVPGDQLNIDQHLTKIRRVIQKNLKFIRGHLIWNDPV